MKEHVNKIRECHSIKIKDDLEMFLMRHIVQNDTKQDDVETATIFRYDYFESGKSFQISVCIGSGNSKYYQSDLFRMECFTVSAR